LRFYQKSGSFQGQNATMQGLTPEGWSVQRFLRAEGLIYNAFNSNFVYDKMRFVIFRVEKTMLYYLIL
jgi:hypothetical protein